MNGFPYFQFHVDKWLTGKISAFDLDEQGLFIHFCLVAWSAMGPFNICSTTVQRRYRKPQEWIDSTVAAFLDVGIIERDGDKYRIKFIDDQVELLTGKRQQRIDAGKASAAARKAAALSSTESIQSKEEKSREEKSREEKSSTLTSRSTTVQRSLVKTFKQWTEKDFLAECNRIHEEKHILPTDYDGTKFYLYWSEPDALGKMRLAKQKTWDTERRMITWRDNNFGGK